jgi:hypothetical protein
LLTNALVWVLILWCGTVSRAMVKLNARDRAQLVVFAYEAGLVRPGTAS